MDALERRIRVRREATEWWVELQAPGVPVERRKQFVEWIRESPGHVSELLQVAQTHDCLADFESWMKISTVGAELDADDETVVRLSQRSPSPVVEATDKRRVFSRAWTITGIAASALLALGISLWMSLSGQTIVTARGELRQVALSDGSVLQVAPQSQIRVKLAPNSKRVIVLERGRVLFKVAKDAHRPFLVYANNTEARAVGTAFAVEKSDNYVAVTVAEGTVAVSSQPNGASRTDQHSRSAVLTVNQQATIRRSSDSVEVRSVNSQQLLAWASGHLVFDEVPLRQVLAEFNRYNQVQMQVADDELANRNISGTFTASDLDTFLAFIRVVAKVDVIEDEARNVTIVAKR